MHIFRLKYPGTFLDYPDQAWISDVQPLLYAMESQFTDAAVSLNLFEGAGALEKQHHEKEKKWEESQGVVAPATFMKELAEQARLSREEADHAREERRQSQLEQKYQAGVWPRAYISRLEFLHAASFLYAMHGLLKVVDILARLPNVPPAVRLQKKLLHSCFSSVEGVRDSTQHFEDRMRGLAKGGKRLKPKPVSNPLVHAPQGGMILLGNLVGCKYGSTLADGRYGEVEVSPASLCQAQKSVQAILNSFKWKGLRRYTPE